MRLSEILRVLGADAASSGSLLELEPTGYSIDSRTLLRGELFFAIKGQNHDGHQFVTAAFESGAIGAIVQRGFILDSHADGRLLIHVDDTLDALQQLAASLIRGWRGRVVGITGSMGKTTTKELTAAVLSSAGRVNKTIGNLNNEYGLPLSVLQMESAGSHALDFDFAVLEMGMNHKGEIRRLTRIAPPDAAIVTAVAPVHLEFFESVDDIAIAKSEIVEGLRPGGVAVLNADDERVLRMASLRDDIEVRTFGIVRQADISARNINTDGVSTSTFRLVTPAGEIDCRLGLAGVHNVYNALAAAAVGDWFHLEAKTIATSLASAVSPKMRGQVIRFARGFSVIDDSYNSNPTALVEMVRTIGASRDALRKIVVAGEMLELGAEGADLHRETGSRIAAIGVDLLIGVRGLASELVEGARSAGMREDAAFFCESPEQAAEFVQRNVRTGDLILVKGSRGVKTERVVQRLRQAFEPEGDGGVP
jgi:UDP-N-acetylmuramoyl-tripeptide--D-alanyl-D-alanine ligase